jgi:putative DNA modification/repair radical SAM protein
MEHMIRALELLRHTYQFHGYLHVKVIPGASQELIRQAGRLADRVSINIEFPSEASLRTFAPDKTKQSILQPMGMIRDMIGENRNFFLTEPISHGLVNQQQSSLVAPQVPKRQNSTASGAATQMIIGATPESDFHILKLSQGLYRKYALKRVFYSAYIPVAEHGLLPALGTPPPLLREHRLYQSDFLLRQYHFAAEEILDDDNPDLNPYLDPKCNWALRHPEFFPVDVNRAGLEALLRVPGIGPRSARRIVAQRRGQTLDFPALKRMGVVLKRAQFFLLTRDYPRGMRLPGETVARALLDPKIFTFGMEQLSLFTPKGLPSAGDVKSIGEAAEEAVQILKENVA